MGCLVLGWPQDSSGIRGQRGCEFPLFSSGRSGLGFSSLWHMLSPPLAVPAECGPCQESAKTFGFWLCQSLVWSLGLRFIQNPPGSAVRTWCLDRPSCLSPAQFPNKLRERAQGTFPGWGAHGAHPALCGLPTPCGGAQRSWRHIPKAAC